MTRLQKKLLVLGVCATIALILTILLPPKAQWILAGCLFALGLMLRLGSRRMSA